MKKVVEISLPPVNPEFKELIEKFPNEAGTWAVEVIEKWVSQGVPRDWLEKNMVVNVRSIMKNGNVEIEASFSTRDTWGFIYPENRILAR